MKLVTKAKLAEPYVHLGLPIGVTA